MQQANAAENFVNTESLSEISLLPGLWQCYLEGKSISKAQPDSHGFDTVPRFEF